MILYGGDMSPPYNGGFDCLCVVCGTGTFFIDPY